MSGLQIGGAFIIGMTLLNLFARFDIGSWYIGPNTYEDPTEKGDRDRVYRDKDREGFNMVATSETIGGLALGVAMLVVG
ncbi:hypothetical protein [Sphingorhabdus sp.]|uniref:hypothetical protein n=1 Tax=Sphingorhabdus sp. TaxID=1902408 RepID=UPI0032B7B1E2